MFKGSLFLIALILALFLLGPGRSEGADTTPPTFSALLVSPASVTNAPRPHFSGSYSDLESGIAIGTARLFLDSQEVTGQAIVSSASFTFTPTQDLSEGDHTLLVTVSDQAGNAGSASLSVTCLYTPPAAPVVEHTTSGPEGVSFYGNAGSNVAAIITQMLNDSGGAAVIEEQSVTPGATPGAGAGIWSARVGRTFNGTPGPFSFTAWLKDRAGNVGAPATITDTLATPEPVYPPVKIESLLPLGYNFTALDAEGKTRYYYDKKSVTVQVRASGGKPLANGNLTVEADGVAATGGSGVYMAALTLREGVNQVRASARDARGQQATQTVTMVVDTTSPVLPIDKLFDTTLTEAVTVQGPLGTLYLNGRTGAESKAIREEAALPRQVFAKSTFSFVGVVREENLDSGIPISMTVRKGGVAVGTPKLLSLTPVVPPTTPPTAAFTASAALAEPTYADSTYEVKLEATDRLGNKGSVTFFVVVDTQGPPGLTAVGNHWDGPFPGPIVGVWAVDAIRVWDGTVPLKRAWRDGPWMLASPVPLSDSISESTLIVEDYAGNKATRMWQAFHQNLAIGDYSEGSGGAHIRYMGDPANNDIDRLFDRGVTAFKKVALAGDQVLGNETAKCILFGDIPQFYEEADNGPLFHASRVAFTGVTIGGRGFLEVAPSWSLKRDYPVAAQGTFPFSALSGTQFGPVGALMTTGVPDSLPPMGTGGTETSSASASFNLGPTVVLNPPYGTQSITQFQPAARAPSFNSNISPGLAWAQVGYSSNWSSGKRTPVPDFADEEYRYSMGSGFNGVSGLLPRAYTLCRVKPDLLRAGMRERVKIEGFFGPDLKPGDLVSIAFTPNGGSGAISVLPVTSTAPAGKGRVLLEDYANSTVYQTIEAYVEPGSAGVSPASGAFDVTISGTSVPAALTLPRVVNVARFGLLVDANHDGQLNGSDYAWQRVPHGVVLLSGFGRANHPAVEARVPVKLDVSEEEGWLDVPRSSILRERGILTLRSNNKKVRFFDAAGVELTDADLTWTRADLNLDQNTYVDANYNVLDPANVRKADTWNLERKVSSDPDVWSPLALADQMSWILKKAGQPDQVLSALPQVNLEFQADEEVTLTLAYSSADGSSTLTTLKLVRLSHGLGGDDGLAPHAAVVPGVTVGLMRGNVHFSETARAYQTPALGPDVSVSYNSLDGLATGLGRGWRTNYDLRLIDGSVDSNSDGTVALTERKNNDPLVFIGVDGRRYLFLYNTAQKKFLSEAKTSLVGAYVDPNPTPALTAGGEAVSYKLVLLDNLIRYFASDGRLLRIENLRKKGLTVAWNSGKQVLSVSDDYGRTESLERDAFGIGAGEYATSLGKRQSAGWGFGYDGASNDQHRRMNSIQVNGQSYFIVYGAASGKPETLQLPEAITRAIVYTPLNSRAVNTKAVIQEAFGTATASTAFVIDALKDFWTSLTDPAAKTTRTAEAARRRVANLSVGSRFKVTFVNGGPAGEMTSRAIAGGTSETWDWQGLPGVEGSSFLQSHTVANAGGSTVYTYHADAAKAGLVQSVKDPSDNLTRYFYGEMDGDGGLDFLSFWIDARNKTWIVEKRNKLGQPEEVLTPLTRPLLSTHTFTGQLASSTGLFGLKTEFAYDWRERALGSVLPGGAFTSLTLDTLGNVTSSTDVNGNTEETDFDGLGRPKKQRRKDKNGVPAIGECSITYTKNNIGWLTVATRGTRELAREQHDLAGRVKTSTVQRVLNPASAPETVTACNTTYTYAPEGWLQSISDPYANKTVIERNDAGRETKVTSPMGNYRQTEYHLAGWVHEIRTPGGPTGFRSTVVECDPCGRAIMETNAKGGYVETAYYPTGQVLSVKPSLGNGETYGLDDDGTPVLTTDKFGKNHQITLNVGARTITEQVDQNPNRTVLAKMDFRGLPVCTDSPLGKTWLKVGSDGLTRSTKPPGRGEYTSEVDALYRPTTTGLPGANPGQQRSVSRTYDGTHGTLATQGTLLGNTLDLTARSAATGEPISEKDSLGVTRKILKRDKNGNVLQYKVPVDATASHDLFYEQRFDKDNRLTLSIENKKFATEYSYTLAGEPELIRTNAEWNGTAALGGDVVLVTYDELGLENLRTEVATQRKVKRQYNEFGQLDWEEVAGQRTLFSYYPGTRLLAVKTLPGGRYIEYQRDSFGRVEKILTSGGRWTRFERDDFDRPTKTTYADKYPAGHPRAGQNRDERYAYIPLGSGPDLLEFVDRAGKSWRPDLPDLAGRLTVKKLFDKPKADGAGTELATVRYTHNDGDLVTAESVSTPVAATNQSTLQLASQSTNQPTVPLPSGGVTRVFDVRGRMQNIAQPGGSCGFTYRLDNAIATKSWSSGASSATLTYSYFNPSEVSPGRLKSVTGAGGTASFAYQTDGRLQKLSLPNGLSRTLTYKAGGYVASMVQGLPAAGTNPAYTESYVFGHDSDGRLKTVDFTDSQLATRNYSLAMGYDGGGHLTSESRSGAGGYFHSYTYDGDDNRKTMTVSGAPVAQVLDFTAAGLPPQLEVESGMWQTVDGKLQAQPQVPPAGPIPGEGEAALAKWNAGSAALGNQFSVKVKPATELLVVDGSSAFAGFHSGTTNTGRHIAGVVVEKVNEAGVEVLKRKLRVAFIPMETGIPEVLAESALKTYANEELGLRFELAGDQVTLSAAGDLEGETLSLPITWSMSGFGLEARGPLGSDLPGQPPTPWTTFDDLAWNELSGTPGTRIYDYNELNQLISISGAQTGSFVYNDLGSMTQQTLDGVTTDFGHDLLNRVATVTSGAQTSIYGYAGPTWMRATATIQTTNQGPQTTNFLFDGFACVSATTGGVTTNYGVIGSTPLWEKTGSASALTYAQDASGNVSGLWGPGAMGFKERFQYDAFGNVKTTDGAGAPLSNSSGPRYRGQQYDAATDQVYLRNRYYSPNLGRFQQLDPSGSPNGPNRYNYCGGDPVNKWDPRGLLTLAAHAAVTLEALKNSGLDINSDELVRGVQFPDMPVGVVASVLGVANTVNAKVTETLEPVTKKIEEYTEPPKKWAWNSTRDVLDAYAPPVANSYRYARNWWQDSSVISPVVETVGIVAPAVKESDVYQTHYGKDQWKHFMSNGLDAEGNPITAKEFQIFVADKTAELIEEFQAKMAAEKPQEAAFALGQALHTIQDSWAKGHVQRNEKGAIMWIQDYSRQSPKLHGNEDEVKLGTPAFDNQVKISTEFLKFAVESKEMKPDALRRSIREKFFVLAEGVKIGETHEDFLPRTAP